MFQNNKILLAQAVNFLQRNEYLRAEQIISSLLKLDPNNIDANEIASLIKLSQGKLKEAISHLELVSLKKPRHISAKLNLANIYFELKNYEKAINYYESAYKLDNKNINILKNYSNLLVTLKQYEYANKILNELHSINLNDENTLLLLVECNYHLKELNQAKILCKKLLNSNEKNIKALFYIGMIFSAEKNSIEAKLAYQKILNIDEKNINTLLNLSILLIEEGGYQDAFIYLNNLLLIDPNNSSALSCLATIYEATNKIDYAIDIYAKALKIDPENSEITKNIGMLQLSQLEFKAGWGNYEKRIATSSFNGHIQFDRNKEWDGSKPVSKLLVISEQGIGDQILYSSMFSDLINDVENITVVISEKLINIYSRSFPAINFISESNYLIHHNQDNFDAIIYSGSLGKIYRKNIDCFQSNRFPYLISDIEKVNTFIKSLSIRKNISVYCGLSWKSHNEILKNKKSVEPIDLKPILELPFLNFLDLQYKSNEPDLSNLASLSNGNFFETKCIDKYNDIDALASIVDICDFVITTSSTTAHISGALGKQTYLLLPYSVGKFWYWHDIDGNSIWYPSLKIFKQKNIGDWSVPILELKKFLEVEFAG